MARYGAFDRIAIKRSKREVTWQRKERPIAQRIVTVDGQLRRGYVAHPDSLVNHFVNDLISAVDQRSYNGWDKTDGNTSAMSDCDPTASVWCIFITHATWLHVRSRSKIQRPWLNGNASHPMHFIRAVDRGLNEDRMVTPKSPYKLRRSSRL